MGTGVRLLCGYDGGIYEALSGEGGVTHVPHLSSLSLRISRGSHVAFGILLF